MKCRRRRGTVIDSAPNRAGKDCPDRLFPASQPAKSLSLHDGEKRPGRAPWHPESRRCRPCPPWPVSTPGRPGLLPGRARPGNESTQPPLAAKWREAVGLTSPLPSSIVGKKNAGQIGRCTRRGCGSNFGPIDSPFRIFGKESEGLGRDERMVAFNRSGKGCFPPNQMI